jgi:hypothetical protein
MSGPSWDTLSSMKIFAALALSVSIAVGQDVQRPRITGLAHMALFVEDIEKLPTLL